LPITRIGILDIVGFFETVLDERRISCRRADLDLSERFVNGMFEFVLL